MDLAYVTSLAFADTAHDYDARESLLYAAALGFGSDPLDRDELPYVCECLAGTPQRAVPLQAAVIAWQPFWQDDARAAIDWKRIVHGEMHLRMHAPLPPAARVRRTHGLVGVQDKGAGRGAVLQVDSELHDRDSGVHLATTQSLQFLRGDGGCGSWGDAARRAPPLAPIDDGAPPIATIEYRTPGSAALLYRIASRDWVPFHADPDVAREAGFERPILHGMYTLGLACRAVLKSCAPGRPDRLRALAARWVQPGLPGDTVRVELFAGEGDGEVRFRATALERGVRLLDRGRCKLD